ncbi:MAG TPA: hypothetical protein VFZ00_27240 [Solirubrobacter sp.]|nr:hypothetical protein [Solirubrobacter sp.]
MQVNSFKCDGCGCTIDNEECPLVIYTVVGVPQHAAEEHGATDVTDYPLPQHVRDILARAVARKELCVTCWAGDHAAPLVDAEGKTVVDPAKFKDRASFRAAVKAKHGAVRAQRLAAKAERAARAEREAKAAAEGTPPVSEHATT